MNELDVVRGDIRDLRTYLDGKFNDIDARVREVEQQAAVSRSMARLSLAGLPFAVVAFSFALVHVFGG